MNGLRSWPIISVRVTWLRNRSGDRRHIPEYMVKIMKRISFKIITSIDFFLILLIQNWFFWFFEKVGLSYTFLKVRHNLNPRNWSGDRRHWPEYKVKFMENFFYQKNHFIVLFVLNIWKKRFSFISRLRESVRYRLQNWVQFDPTEPHRRPPDLTWI